MWTAINETLATLILLVGVAWIVRLSRKARDWRILLAALPVGLLAAAQVRVDVGTVVIATRHDSHARLVCEALQAGKNVFVEKPLALTAEELSEIEEAYAEARGLLMVGINRRFAPHVVKAQELLAAKREPGSNSRSADRPASRQAGTPPGHSGATLLGLAGALRAGHLAAVAR